MHHTLCGCAHSDLLPVTDVPSGLRRPGPLNRLQHHNAPDDRQSTSGRSLRTTCRRRAAARSHSSFRRPATASTRIVALRSPSALEGSAWNDDETREPCRACGCPRRNEPLSGGANKRARSAASVPAQPQAVAACALYAGHTLPVPHDCPLVLLSGDGPVVMTVGDARTPLAPRRSSLR